MEGLGLLGHKEVPTSKHRAVEDQFVVGRGHVDRLQVFERSRLEVHFHFEVALRSLVRTGELLDCSEHRSWEFLLVAHRGLGMG